MPNSQKNNFSWVGSEENFLDHPHVIKQDSVFIGRFGGNTKAGGNKNEDGCLAWTSQNGDWEYVMILDGHNSANSVELVIETFEKEKRRITSTLNLSAGECFSKLDSLILEIFHNPSFKEACRNVIGETNCLIAVRKDKYLWWFSIGDNLLFLFHDELTSFGQYLLNQRSFYEWVGQVNTFELEVPCYSTGRKELRSGENLLLLTTDGLVECPNEPYQNPESIKRTVKSNATMEEGLISLLKTVEKNKGTDSTTMVSWTVNIEQKASYASDQFKKKTS